MALINDNNFDANRIFKFQAAAKEKLSEEIPRG
jgi:hypothetical protein